MFNITPTAGSADHAGMAPANQQQFQAQAVLPPTVQGCIYNNVISSLQWTSSDTVDIQLAANQQTGSVVATCVNATETPATISVTQYRGGITGTGTATLTCK